MIPNNLPKIFTTQQSADILNVSVAWLERQRWLGTGPVYIKIGRSVRYPESSLVEYLNTNTIRTTNQVG